MRRIFLTLAAVLPMVLGAFCLPPVAGDVGVGYDFFRSIPDGDWDGNTGALAEFNVGTPLPFSNLGFQFGSSYGIYDWYGKRSSEPSQVNEVEQQVFLSTGVFKKSSCINAGILYDWMWNRGFGVAGVGSSFSQLRMQVGYQRNCNEFGLWGTLDLGKSHRNAFGIPLTFRAISQINLYWQHYFSNCSQTMVWVGMPYKKSLAFNTGRAGKFIAGASFEVPLTGRFCIAGHGSYMAPHSAPGGLRERYYAANICIELKYLFGDVCCGTVPYMPLANNSVFIADTNNNF